MKCNPSKRCSRVASFTRAPLKIVLLVHAAMNFGCASAPAEPESAAPPETSFARADARQPKSLFVFLDGTRNDTGSQTNVWRLYGLVASNKDAANGIYLEGVGSRENPLWGMALGRGMESQILRGYEFLTLNYNPGDRIHIFGFSRGAHAARSLAGLIAYSGIPEVANADRDRLMKIGNKIIEVTKKKSDKDFLEKWSSWTPGQAPLLASKIKAEHGFNMRAADVSFLGIWDTVPGSAFKKFDDCMEREDRRAGDRYKSGSYPPIRNIAHAVSLDEQRSKFKPILVCDAMNPNFTKVTEEWFPGAHADVGGGYSDSSELPGISLNWMLGLLGEVYQFHPKTPTVEENAKGLAHWSIGDAPANWGSECEPRKPTLKARIHPSVDDRKKEGMAPLRIKGVVDDKATYPKECPM